MKNSKLYKFNLLALLSGAMMFSACEGILDQEPLSSLTEAVYFKTPDQFEAAANYLYGRLGFEANNDDMDFDACDMTENYGETEPHGWGSNSIDENYSNYTNAYIWLRRSNIIIEKAAEYEGDITDIYQSLGTAYFFRAWDHNRLLDEWGGVPIAARVMDTSYDEVWGPRNSRYEVIAQIISDLDMIIDNNMVPDYASIPSSEIGKVSMEAVKAFKARVCLNAATWDKYVGTTTDGDGVTSGAGSYKPDNYPSTTELFTMAQTLSQTVMNSSNFELWDKSEEPCAADPTNQYFGPRHLYYLFSLDDALSNPWGYTKADNKEYIFQTIYDYTYRQIGSNISHAQKWGQNRKACDMYLCTDGLPPHLSSVFQGYEVLGAEFENRDERMIGLVKNHTWRYWDNYTMYNTDYTYDVTDTYSVKAISNADYEAAGNPTGFAQKSGLDDLTAAGMAAKRSFCYIGDKFVTEHIGRADTDESYNYPLIRLAEMYLIYAEATYELNGSITDAQLDASINKLRARANVASLTNALVNSQPTLTMLGEIRRERGIELFGETFRHQDLRRWGIAEQELNQAVYGVYLKWQGEWTEQTSRMSAAAIPYNPTDADLTFLNDGGASVTLIDNVGTSYSSYEGFAPIYGGAVMITPKSWKSYQRKHYLNPMPQAQLDLNENLLQNPDW